jgi:hypothetical protein
MLSRVSFAEGNSDVLRGPVRVFHHVRACRGTGRAAELAEQDISKCNLKNCRTNWATRQFQQRTVRRNSFAWRA